jgi:hypothetical protein
MNEDDNPKERFTMLTQRLALALALAIEAHGEQKRSLPTSLGKAHG